MKITGWCERCHRVRPVAVGSAGMAMLARGKVAAGICTECQQKEDDEREARRTGATPVPATGRALADHVEIDHERELAGVNVRELRSVHAEMHRQRQDWGHHHGRTHHG